MVLGRDRERGREATEREVLDLLEGIANVLARRFLAFLRDHRQADRFELDRCLEYPAIVHHGIFDHLLRDLLVLGLVHGLDVFDHLVVPTDTGVLQRVIAFSQRPAACGHDVGFRTRPDEPYGF